MKLGESGEGTFTCGQVRFVIDSIENADPDQQKMQDQAAKDKLAAQQQAEKAQRQLDANKKTYEAAKAKYGDNAGYWLGLQDAIEACKAAGQSCTIVIGSDGSPLVVNKTK